MFLITFRHAEFQTGVPVTPSPKQTESNNMGIGSGNENVLAPLKPRPAVNFVCDFTQHCLEGKLCHILAVVVVSDTKQIEPDVTIICCN
jgi:hypothetical protein